MGRRIRMMHRLPVTALLLLVAATGCTPETAFSNAGSAQAAAQEDPHDNLTCAACHAFTLGTEAELVRNRLLRSGSQELRVPAPEVRCAGAGCHEDAGPREVSFGSVSFEHRNHGAGESVEPSCAGCHTHATGEAPLTTSVDACSLCHLGEQAAGNNGECRLCHTDLSHAGASSQGLAIPHESLPWIDGGCVRCHYDMADPPAKVTLADCTTCHPEDEGAALGLGEDLHPNHEGFSCLACHEGDRHGIQAMSSAVELSCRQCHVTSHGIDLTAEFPSSGTCNACHVDSHQAEQRLVLGVVPGVEGAQPSEKFMDGLTCRSCHVTSAVVEGTETVEGSDDGCLSCHRQEFGTVLEWWRSGVEDRLALVQASARRAASLPRDSSGAAALDSAGALLSLVEVGSGVHNLPLAHRVLQQAADQVQRAWTLSGRTPPPALDLGREPTPGLCSYCHYRLNDPWVFSEMSGEFHRDVRVGRRPVHPRSPLDGGR